MNINSLVNMIKFVHRRNGYPTEVGDKDHAAIVFSDRKLWSLFWYYELKYHANERHTYVFSGYKKIINVILVYLHIRNIKSDLILSQMLSFLKYSLLKRFRRI